MTKFCLKKFLSLIILFCLAGTRLLSMEDTSEEGKVRTQLCRKIRDVSNKIAEDPPQYPPNVAAAYVHFSFGEYGQSFYEPIPILFLSGWQAAKSYSRSDSSFFYLMDISSLKKMAGGYKIKFISHYSSTIEAFKGVLTSQRGIREDLNTSTFFQNYCHSEQAALSELESFIPDNLRNFLKCINDKEDASEGIDVSIKATILSRNPICQSGACSLSASTVAENIQRTLRLKYELARPARGQTQTLTRYLSSSKDKQIQLKSLNLTIDLEQM